MCIYSLRIGRERGRRLMISKQPQYYSDFRAILRNRHAERKQNGQVIYIYSLYIVGPTELLSSWSCLLPILTICLQFPGPHGRKEKLTLTHCPMTTTHIAMKYACPHISTYTCTCTQNKTMNKIKKYNSNIQEAEASGSLWVQGQPSLQELVPGQGSRLQKNKTKLFHIKN